MLSTKMKPQYRNSKKQKVSDGQTNRCAQTSLDAPANASEQTRRNVEPSCGLILKKVRGIENT